VATTLIRAGLNDQLKDMQRYYGSAMTSDAFLDGIGEAQYIETLWYPGPADLTVPQDTYEDEYYVEIWIDNDQRYTHFLRWSVATPKKTLRLMIRCMVIR